MFALPCVQNVNVFDDLFGKNAGVVLRHFHIRMSHCLGDGGNRNAERHGGSGIGMPGHVESHILFDAATTCNLLQVGVYVLMRGTR